MYSCAFRFPCPCQQPQSFLRRCFSTPHKIFIVPFRFYQPHLQLLSLTSPFYVHITSVEFQSVNFFDSSPLRNLSSICLTRIPFILIQPSFPTSLNYLILLSNQKSVSISKLPPTCHLWFFGQVPLQFILFFPSPHFLVRYVWLELPRQRLFSVYRYCPIGRYTKGVNTYVL